MPRPVRRNLLCLALAAVVALAVPVAQADSEFDHERARAAVERGEALPLLEILSRLGPELGGEVAGVSFERKRSGWLYELKVIEPGGRLVELHVDAASGRILRREED